jgi:hypothetical protein
VAETEQDRTKENTQKLQAEHFQKMHKPLGIGSDAAKKQERLPLKLGATAALS